MFLHFPEGRKTPQWLRLSGKQRSTVTSLLVQAQGRPVLTTESTILVYTKLPIFSSRKISKSSNMLGAQKGACIESIVTGP